MAVISLALALAGIWVFAPPTELPAEFSEADCRRVSLADDVTGNLIIGAEDIALTPSENELLFTAHDRRAPDNPSGGLYAVSTFALEAGESALTATRIYAGEDTDRAFRPHGFALSRDGSRLALVNRPTSGSAEVLIGPVENLSWAPEERLAGERLCRANDLSFTADAAELYITLDRADCAPSAQDLIPGAASGRLARFDGTALTEPVLGLSFPNGLAGGYVAETRAMQISQPGGGAIRLPGGPDNLSVDQDGWIVAAVHPKLLQLWLYRSGWRQTAPSRIVRVDPEDGEIRVLFDDTAGRLFSGATSAIYGNGLLVAGSAYDEGLLVCQEPF
ncbi:MAG: hypothetical protein AAGH68_00580 [Pseudomonadota bacterium]